MRRIVSLAMVALATIVSLSSCSKDATSPNNTQLQFVATPQVAAETSTVSARANMPAMWHLTYGKTPALELGRIPAGGEFGPSLEFRARIPVQPSNVATTYFFAVTASDAEDPRQTITLDGQFQVPAVTLLLSPKPVTADVGEAVRFTATPSVPLVNGALIWASTIGSIDSTGLLTNLTVQGTGTVTACERAYPTICDSSTVSVSKKDLIAYTRIDSIPSARCWGARCEEIYTMLSTGAEVRRVTTTPVFQDFQPAWFKDGRKFAFVRTRSGPAATQAICTANADGSDVRCIILPSVNATGPAVSPDGRHIAFAYYDQDANGSILRGGIAIMDTSGANLVRRTARSCCSFDSDPDWSPDGRSIIFARNGDIYRMPVDGDEPPVNITNTPSIVEGQPVYSPDGSRLAVTASLETRFQVFVMNANGTNRFQVTHDPMKAGDQTWSPDGRRIAYIGGCCEAETMDIYIVSAEGGTPVNVTNTPGLGEAFLAWRP